MAPAAGFATAAIASAGSSGASVTRMSISAPRDRRDEGEGGTGRHRRILVGVLLVDGVAEARQERLQLRVSRRQAVAHVPDAIPGSDIDHQAARSEPFRHPSEEEDGYLSHASILACRARPARLPAGYAPSTMAPP